MQDQVNHIQELTPKPAIHGPQPHCHEQEFASIEIEVVSKLAQKVGFPSEAFNRGQDATLVRVTIDPMVQFICPMPLMCIVLLPAIRTRAIQNDSPPSIGWCLGKLPNQIL